jgi:hypothetical protein
MKSAMAGEKAGEESLTLLSQFVLSRDMLVLHNHVCKIASGGTMV